ncbi:MAG: nitroreductase [Holophaga sp.]|nr:nitroreductase [Holophaga sp.]
MATLTNSVAATPAEAICSRRSVRAFLPTPVPRPTVERILDIARQAPSGSNIQPWHVQVVAGSHRDRLVQAILAADDADAPGYEQEYRYYPEEWTEPYLRRRRQLGKALYQLAGVPKGDLAAMKRQRALNYAFFHAPVGLFFTLDKRQGYGAWIDLGAFLQSVMIAARGEGLHTCPQAAFSKYHRIIRQHLPIPEDDILVCGMALGLADPEAPVNRLVPERAAVSEFTSFLWD